MRFRPAVAILSFALMAVAHVASAQQTAEAVVSGDSGESVFKTYCGACHGRSATGDGPLAASLRYRPADLTRIAKRNGGKFDPEKVYRIIDGRDRVKSHGGTDMPVWGDAFKGSVAGYSDKAVKARIESIVDYLKTIQAK